jgi:hypothetical protein
VDQLTRTNLENINSKNSKVQYKAFIAILAATDKPVDWAYQVWDEMVERLNDQDNHERAIAHRSCVTLRKATRRLGCSRTCPLCLH